MLKYCILGLKKVLFGFFDCFQGTFWSTKYEKKLKLKNKRNNKKLLFLTTFIFDYFFSWAKCVDEIFFSALSSLQIAFPFLEMSLLLIETRMASDLLPSFLDQVKSRQLSNWADESEAHDEISVLLAQPKLTPQEFSKCLYELVQRFQVDLDSPQTAFYHQVKDTYISFMIGKKQFMISMTCDQQAEPQKPKSEVSSAVETKAELAQQIDEPASEDQKPMPEEEEAQVDKDSDGWETVGAPKRKSKPATVVVNPIYLFRDAGNSPLIDFVKTVNGMSQMVKEAKKLPWAHGFSPDENLVYDFHNCSRRGRYRVFAPNSVYLSKFANWMKNQKDVDQRCFAVFVEVVSDDGKSDRKVLVDIRYGLANVRQFVKRFCLPRFQWAHAYCEEHDFVYDFHIKDFTFVQSTRRLTAALTEQFKLSGPLTADHIEMDIKNGGAADDEDSDTDD